MRGDENVVGLSNQPHVSLGKAVALSAREMGGATAGGQENSKKIYESWKTLARGCLEERSEGGQVQERKV